MSLTTSLVALALWGAGPAQPAVAVDFDIACEVQMMTVEGLDWRNSAYSQLKPAARQGSATIWTADRSLKPILERRGVKSTKAPKVTTTADAVATVNSDQTQNYISHIERVSDGPINGGTTVAYQPEVGTMREGFNAIYSGRRIQQGVLARVKLTESHVGSLHTIKLTEQLKGAAPEPVSLDTPFGVVGEVEKRLIGPTVTTLATTVQIPEVFQSEVAGEWFVPKDGFLLISMGVNTVADAHGKAVVQERLAILDFTQPEPLNAAPATAMTPACRVETDGAVMPVSLAHLAMPAIPSRSCPEAVDHEGNVVEPSPVAEALAATDLNQIAPGSPLATPQTAPKPLTDQQQLARLGALDLPPLPEAYASSTLNQINPDALPVAPSIAARSMVDPNLARTSLELIPDSEIETPAIGKPIDLDFNIVAPHMPGLAGLVESAVWTLGEVLYQTTQPVCDTPDCPAEGCPFSAEGCDDGKTKTNAAPNQPTAAKVEMGVSVRDGKGTCVFNAEEDLVAALKTPGKAEVKYVPLGNNLALEIRAQVVAQPTSAFKPERVAELKIESEKLRQTGDEWQRFWFLDQSSRMTPIRTEGGSKP